MRNSIINRVLALVISSTVIFSGCAGKQQVLGDKENSEAHSENVKSVETAEEDKGPFYLLTQTIISDLDESMIPEDITPSDGIYVIANRLHPIGDYAYIFWDRKVTGNTICEMYRLCGAGVEPEKYAEYENPEKLRHLVGFLIRVLNAESGEEKSFVIRDDDFNANDGSYNSSIDSLIGMYSDKLYTTLSIYSYSEADNSYQQSGLCVGGFDAEGHGTVVAEIPIEYSGWDFFFDNGKLCVIDYNGSNLVCFDENFENPRNYVMSPRAQGYFCTEDGNAYYYGVKNSELWIKDDPDSEPVYTLRGSYEFEDYTDYAITINGDVIFAANTQGAYRLENGEITYCSFTDQDFFLDAVNGAFPRADGGFSLFGICDGEYSVFDATPCDTNPRYMKSNIYLLAGFGMDDLKKAVSRYNRRSDKCRIILKEPDITEGYSNMISNLSMEMAMGNGPDIFASSYYDCVSLAAKGGIVPLDDLIEGAVDEYILPAFESCKIGGTLYSIPYSPSIHTFVTSEEFAGGKTNYTLSEFMERVEESGTEKAIDLSRQEIVYWLGVDTPEESGFIDWEQRKSNYDSKEFIDLLKFAYKYGVGEGEQYSSAIYQDIYDGKIPCMMGRNVSLNETNRYDAYFKGSPVYIGIPTNNGSSFLINGGMSLCINASSEYKEEAKDFLKWLISKDGQQAFYDAQYMVTHGEFFSMTLRWDIFDEQIEAHNYYNSGGILTFEKPDGSFESFEVGPRSSGNVTWRLRQLTDGEIDLLKDMIRNAKPEHYEHENIYNIVEEELGGFLAGQKTAEETAKVIHSRVQLYLDENR